MSGAGLSLDWDSATPQSWAALQMQAGRSNLLQAWGYGEAKQAVGNWTVERVTIMQADRVVGFCQVLRKSWLGLAGVVRLNRGPLWLDGHAPSDGMLTDFFARLRRDCSIGLHRPLLVAPELPDSEAARKILRAAGLHRRNAPAWASDWLSLDLPVEALRRQLDGKWRNMLVGAEREGLQLEVSRSAEAFEWIRDRHQEAMKERGFAGLPVVMLDALHQAASAAGDLVVLQANHGGDRVAGILLARHGKAGTYLVGWTGAQGRRVRATHFLLWNAVCQLKGEGCRWLDLGGYEESAAPGIARFKRGMGGDAYRLVGEYVAV